MAHDTATILKHLPGTIYRVSAEPPWQVSCVNTGPPALGAVADALTAAAGRWEGLIHPDEREEAVAAISEAVGHARGFSLTHRLAGQAQDRWMLNRAEPVIGSDGKVEALAGLIIDVTDDRAELQALRESESHFRAFVDLTAEVHWAADADGNLIESGERWLEQIGRPPDPCAYWRRALHEDDRDRIEAAWRHCVETGSLYDQRYRLRLPDGEYRWFRARGAPLRGPGGQVIKWYGTLENVHDSEVAQQELRKAERRYALAARATGEIIWEWELDTDRIRRVAEPALLGSLGLDTEGNNAAWERRVHPDDLARVRASFREVAQGTGDTWSAEYRVRRPSGGYATVLDRAFLVRDGQGKPERLIGAMQDVTAQKTAEQDLRELQLELIHMSQVNAAATMATNLAHELNQPLTACANYLAQIRMVLADGEDGAGEASATAERAEAQILRAGRAIRQMRALVRDGRPCDGGVPFEEVVEWVTKLMNASNVCPEVVLRTRSTGESGPFAAERMQVAQVILNLVAEACEMVERSSAPEVEISSHARHGTAEVEIHCPLPISEAQAGRVLGAFDGLATPDTDRLSVARTIVEAQGGRVWAEREADLSLSFHFTVPIHSGAPPQAPRTDSSAVETALDGARRRSQRG